MDEQHSLLRYFAYQHLPDHLQVVSRKFFELAFEIDSRLVDGSEKTVSLRKLLEAKDAAVRTAAIDGMNYV